MQDKYPNSECVTPHVIKCWKISNPKGVYKLTAGSFAGYVRMPNDKEIKKLIESGSGSAIISN